MTTTTLAVAEDIVNKFCQDWPEAKRFALIEAIRFALEDHELVYDLEEVASAKVFE